MFHIVTILRTYLQLSQLVLAKQAGITQPDLSEIENHPPYGQIDKYRRLSTCLKVPVEALLKNRPDLVPLSFFEAHPAPSYTPAPKNPYQMVTRSGEEFIYQREQERLQASFPALARLVLPHYKLKGSNPGYDILSFDDEGIPYAIEVKTASTSQTTFDLTDNELKAAKAITDSGFRYVICHISSWQSPKQQVVDREFSLLQKTHTLMPHHYRCVPNPRPTEISGIAYWRQQRGLRQEDVAEAFGIPACDLSLYETGSRSPSVGFYLRLSELLEVTVDQLLDKYSVGKEAF